MIPSPAAPPQAGAIRLPGGIVVRYWVYNAQPAGPAMVLVHGLAGSHHGFEALAAQLPGVQLIVPDVPGFGYSSLPPRRDWTVAGLARLLNQFVAALAMQSPPYLLGHSMGGLVASCMVAQRPELYQRKLVLLSPVPTPVTWRDSRWPGMLAGAVHYTIGATTGPVGSRLVRSKALTWAVTAGMLRTRDTRVRRAMHRQNLYHRTLVSSPQFYRQLYGDINARGAIDYTPTLRRHQVLLIAGLKDNVTPTRQMDRLAQAITPAQYVVLPGTGHLLHMEATPAIAGAVRRFLVC